MKKIINIEKQTIEVPIKVEIDGKSYPIHKWNMDVVKEYESTKDESVLEKLKDFSLSFD